MAGFLSKTDIGNRALQHCGASLMGALGFAEVTKGARQVSFVYDKLRRAELQRNTWRFAIRKVVLRPIDTDTMLLAPALWSSAATYFVGSIVSDENGTLWESNIPDNLNNQPELSSAWSEFCKSMTVPLYDSDISYRSGEIVYTAPGDGTNRVYMSLIDGNEDNPATATAWDATVTYYKNQVVTRSSVAYMSRIDLNLNRDPASTFVAEWSSVTVYASGQKATGSDGVIYQSVVNGNVANDPVADTGTHWTNTGVLSPWDTTFVSGSGSVNWRQIGGAEFPFGVTLTRLNITWPVGSGPESQFNTLNVYRLPANFLRKAPRGAKAGMYSALGAPGNLLEDDWEFAGQYFTSQYGQAIIFPFVADTVDVATFDDMFCEGLGARIGLEISESMTQEKALKQQIGSEYNRFMSEARTVNAILIGAEDPPLDDYIAVRY